MRVVAAHSSSPILDGVLAWVDCVLDTVHRAGDHETVVGRVRGLNVVRAEPPLIFVHGAFGQPHTR